MIAKFPLSSTIELTDGEFEKISRLVYEQCGINLSEGKKELVRARLGKRIREGQFKSFKDYYRYVVEDPSGDELIYLLDSISTNFTSFFREISHFDYLRSRMVPEWMAAKRIGGYTLRIWSAGCSSGEEPYSIVVVLLDTIKNPSAWDLSVLGTDISSKVLKTAQSGIYPKERIRAVPKNVVKRYFLRGDHQWQDYVKVKDQVRQYVHFKRLNLMEPFSFKEPFDCIFCRNVMIYFDKKTQAALVNRFYGLLQKGGYLVIGHSESLTGIQHPFVYLKPTIYKRTE